jgi:hypothetical protein
LTCGHVAGATVASRTAGAHGEAGTGDFHRRAENIAVTLATMTRPDTFNQRDPPVALPP